jgi:hypothetical protein
MLYIIARRITSAISHVIPDTREGGWFEKE